MSKGIIVNMNMFFSDLSGWVNGVPNSSHQNYSTSDKNIAFCMKLVSDVNLIFFVIVLEHTGHRYIKNYFVTKYKYWLM